MPSYEGWSDCFTYDQALSCIAFVLRGDFKRAEDILDFYNKTYHAQIKRYGKFIGFSNAYHKEGLYKATKELINLGHKRIAFLAGAFKFQMDQNRCAGYKKALQETGIIFDERLLGEGFYNYEKAFEAAGELLRAEPRITGLIASDDMMALAAIRRIRDAGLSVPEHVSVIGFNDMFIFPTASPTLSSMRVPLVEIGKTAAQMLLKIINREKLDEEAIMFTSELIRRESAKPA